MQLEKALEQAKELEEIKKSQEKNGYFCSALTTLEDEETIDRWQLGFYLPQRELITTIEVTEDSCKITNSDKPIKQDISELKGEEVEVSARSALDKAKGKLEEDYGGRHSKTILSLKNKEGSALWSVAFVRKNMTIISIEIEGHSGDVVSVEEKKLFEKR